MLTGAFLFMLLMMLFEFMLLLVFILALGSFRLELELLPFVVSLLLAVLLRFKSLLLIR